jgi:GrpB-like predicted nucleotidyltransferase (UPF0157 family)
LLHLREDRRRQIALSEDPEASLIDLAIHEEVSLAAYDAAWVARFVAERARLHAEFPQLLEIEHFGSTAVPGMPAKPIIDILAGVESMAIADALFEPILAFGYTTSRAFNAMLADRRWFMRCANGRRTHHLHVVVFEGQAWTARIRFRDMLRSSTLLALQYAELKSALAVRYRHDREAYSEAKSAFVAAVVARA